MLKEGRFFLLLLAVAAIVLSNGCKHKPAYSDIDANRTASSRAQSVNENSGTTPAPDAAPELPPAPASQPPVSQAPPAQRFKSPSFIDQATGGIKDLPNYPRAKRSSIQIGPNQGFNVMALVFQTPDSMGLIAEFYQKAIKDNRWTVVASVIDPELSEWTIKKGEENTAKIEVKKDPATSKMNISILRAEKLEEISK